MFYGPENMLYGHRICSMAIEHVLQSAQIKSCVLGGDISCLTIETESKPPYHYDHTL